MDNENTLNLPAQLLRYLNFADPVVSSGDPVVDMATYTELWCFAEGLMTSNEETALLEEIQSKPAAMFALSRLLSEVQRTRMEEEFQSAPAVAKQELRQRVDDFLATETKNPIFARVFAALASVQRTAKDLWVSSTEGLVELLDSAVQRPNLAFDFRDSADTEQPIGEQVGGELVKENGRYRLQFSLLEITDTTEGSTESRGRLSIQVVDSLFPPKAVLVGTLFAADSRVVAQQPVQDQEVRFDQLPPGLWVVAIHPADALEQGDLFVVDFE
ncbi:MAG: hypothetical protein JNK57_13330 [Planctomycetaceae bacterium]|nr:hypothetical protein [Planctomycetaceae bacterium]